MKKGKFIKLLTASMAVAILLSPVIVLADETCRCPDCACDESIAPAKDCCQPEEPCPWRNRTMADAGAADDQSSDINDKALSDTESQADTKTKGCHCNLNIYCNSNAILLEGDSGLSATVDKCYQHAPGSFTNSGWVYQILHPPR